MHIPCPHCGPRDSSEFVYRGDATPRRPAEVEAEAVYAYVYLRDNPAGMIREHWYHAQGCRNWIVVTRNTVTHEIAESALACGTSA
ncbi:MAG: sarcosine oxidase subunit delta [Novosphingobium sp. 28-62-57]|uniref:sarcosine oxidase subunit delta n=1 Tax=unclassified Novosphingobium TaxID=2644732 RepID=UPI000BC6E675|nr:MULTISPECIES: sarcosine oxidase subunit delta [unclassified Novosphingobium]OYW47998.1 MAG: sarcosine oxidase subunit delta [Novosphingobium sp. 12-63-9]OYZ10892.1 MAG: sarcosine oxidase subunit delta [Novosphingobium sp. 28-62-57]OZA31495.1 MAG: sarcosine oxidase subunit delta [Novosphingobium sp. 17-62-9]HQS68560.1 sarcosine oxidase subunit delta [Novosphingobium sp.]